ncbi:Crp/Fnr family transcriptional regulator [Vibrio ponticus]|uniref:Crp/Fnr family transcriptional regulator n=1 Tax=Vibrio ponticus TaxID=265668 RepID=A0A3N3DRG3_9VIBR|nr:Crp/Fnr family transcriptional regulator [Vibrio ponticus]ROV57091.1 Crp/Fnr family transcriptional regulator [Vibrio ponticus]
MDSQFTLASLNALQSFQVQKRDSIYRNGTPASGFYYVKSGQIGLYQVSEIGKESLLRIYGTGSFFGYRSLFTQQKYPATSRAMLESEIVKIRIDSMHELERSAPELALTLMQEVCKELGEAEKRLLQYSAFSSKKRILDALIDLFTHYPSYPWTYREIGEFSGTDTSTVIRYCNQLKQVNLLLSSSRKPRPVQISLLQDYRYSLDINPTQSR